VISEEILLAAARSLSSAIVIGLPLAVENPWLISCDDEEEDSVISEEILLAAARSLSSAIVMGLPLAVENP